MSDKTKHTPGPWRTKREGFSTVYVEARIDGGLIQEVAACGPTDAGLEQQEANARLIAAAPELLEAAKLVLEWYEAEDNHSGTDFYQRMQMCRDSEDAVRAAIAKATGEPA